MKELTYDNITKSTGIAEYIVDGLQKLCEDIKDVNTEAKKKRSFTLTIEVTPNEERNVLECHIIPKLKLAGHAGHDTTLMIKEDGKGGHTILDMNIDEHADQHNLVEVLSSSGFNSEKVTHFKEAKNG